MTVTYPLGARKDAYAAVARDGEAITDSRLSKQFSWPSFDPRQNSGANPLELDLDLDAIVDEAATSTHVNWDTFHKRHRHLSVEARVLELLNHRAFQFNSRESFRSSATWRTRIQDAVDNGRTIDVVLPVFCVISNPVKRLQSTVPTAAEDVSLLHLSKLAGVAAEIYEPGIVFHLVADSTFYSPAFGVTSVEAHNYVSMLTSRVHDLGISDRIHVHDISELLSQNVNEFQERFEHWYQRLSKDPLADGISAGDYDRWLASMAASINTRKLGLSYEDMRAVFGPDDGATRHDAIRAEILQRARWALNDYRAVKIAATDLHWEDRYFPGALRATIHTKKVPVLGIRLYPEYKFSSRLLPYHGIGVVSYSAAARRHRLTVEPELLISGRPEFARITDHRGTTLFYYKTERS